MPDEVKLPPVATIEKNTALATIRTSDRGGLVLRTVEDIRTVAQIIFQSKIAPDSFKTPEQIFVGIQHGAELGLKPMQSLQSIYIIKNIPTLWGDAALALVRNSGLLTYHKEWIELDGVDIKTLDADAEAALWKDLSKTPDRLRGVCVTQRIGEDEKKQETYSVADAKIAGLWKKSGSWTTNPKRMLKYKPRAFNLRDNFTDVLKGMHLAEEMMGEEMPGIPQSTISPREERRKSITDVVVTDRQPVSDTEGSKDADDAGKIKEAEDVNTKEFYQWSELDGQVVCKFEMLKYGNYGTTPERQKEFDEWASFVLCDDVDTSNDVKLSVDQLGQLKRELETNGVVDYESASQ